MKKNIKVIIGITLGIIIGTSVVVKAATLFRSEDITYSSDKTNKINVKDSLDELYDLTSNYEFYKPLADQVELGDYISMTPTSTSYLVSQNLTGYDSTQTINPSELNLWRVIKKNNDGTIEAISEYVSPEMITFKGKTGYINYVGALNEIASQYINLKYVESTRHYGYNMQTKFIADITKIDNTIAPWTTSTGSTAFNADGHGNEFEQLGGGDVLNLDWTPVTNSIGSVRATTPEGNGYQYFVSSRYYSYGSSSDWQVGVRYVNAEGGTPGCHLWAERTFNQGAHTCSAMVRPILKLKANDKIISGDGKSAETAYIFE